MLSEQRRIEENFIMKTKEDITIKTAERVLDTEAAAITALKGRLGAGFREAVEILLNVEGKVVVTGMGKSGIICQKIAATLASTGTPAFFLHPAEGIHGDLGMLMKSDVLLAVSNSGETDEVLTMLPAVKRLGLKMIAMTGRIASKGSAAPACTFVENPRRFRLASNRKRS